MKLQAVKNKIIDQTGKTPKEVDVLIYKKKEDLEFLINDEAASHIIAEELDVDLKKPVQKAIDPLDKVVDRIEKETMKFGYLDSLLNFDKHKAKQIIREELFDEEK